MAIDTEVFEFMERVTRELYGTARVYVVDFFVDTNIALTPVANTENTFTISETILDGQTLGVNGVTFFLGNQTTEAENGIYVVESLLPTKIARFSAFVAFDQIDKAIVNVLQGSYADDYFNTVTQDLPFVINVTPILVTNQGKPPSVTDKADKVAGANNGDIATLDATGNLSNSNYQIETTVSGASAKIPDSSAIVAYINSLLSTVFEYRDTWDASGNVYPSDAVGRGDVWVISVAGTLGGTPVESGDVLISKVDNPGQTPSNWSIVQRAYGYTPENELNKSSDATLGGATPSETLYPNQLAVKTYADTKLANTLNTGKIFIGNASNIPTAVAPSALTESVSSVLAITGGGSALVNSASIEVRQATTAQAGYLSSTDWNTFNSKQDALTLPLPITEGGTGQITANDALNALLPAQAGNSTKILQTDGVNSAWVDTPTTGITSISVVSDNGFAGTIADPTTTPAITLSTTATGILKGDGTAISGATSGVDYIQPNIAITGDTKTKITYDSLGLVTAGADATASDIVNTPAGNIIATDVQSAINELDVEKAIDADVVHLAGDETITGNKTFSGVTTLSTLTASSNLELDASQNIISSTKNTAFNQNFETVDSNITMNSIASAGVSNAIPRADHIHPSDITKADKVTTILPADVTENGTLVGGGSLALDRTLDTANFVKGSLATGLISGGTITGTIGGSTFNIAPATGLIVNNETDPINPVVNYVNALAITGINIVPNTHINYVLLDSAGLPIVTSTAPTAEITRQAIYIGRITLNNAKTGILEIVNAPRLQRNISSQFHDILNKYWLNVGGISLAPNGANMQLNLTGGSIIGAGIGHAVSASSPNIRDIPNRTAFFFRMATQSSVIDSFVTNVPPATFYDLGGTITINPSGNGSAIIHRVYLHGNGNIIIQYGQTIYSKLDDAVEGLTAESFVVNPINQVGNAICIGYIVVTKDATSLLDDNRARFFRSSPFGEAVAGVSSSTTYTGANGITVSGAVISSNGTSAPTAGTLAQWDLNSNLNANNFVSQLSSTTTSVSSITLTAGSDYNQRFTGSVEQTVILPDATTLLNGFSFNIINESTASVLLQDASLNLLGTVTPSSNATITLVSNATADGIWYTPVAPTIVATTDYASARINTIQSITAGGTIAVALSDGKGNIPLASSQFTLNAGKTYRIHIGFRVDGPGYLQAELRNVTDNVTIDSAWIASRGDNLQAQYMSSKEFIFTPASNTSIGIQASAVTNFMVIQEGFVTITQIGSSAVIISSSTPKLTSQFSFGALGFIFIYKNQLWRSGQGTNSPFGKGLLGSPGSGNTQIPTVIATKPTFKITGWQDVVYATDSAIALTNDGRVFQWGLGIAGSPTVFYPEQVPFPAGVIVSKIYMVNNREFVNFLSFFAISSTGAVYSWGINNTGQLGLGDTAQRATPTLVTFPAGAGAITKISVSGTDNTHTVAINSAGALYGWGANVRGNLGTGDTVNRLTPTLITIPNVGQTVTDVIAIGQSDRVIATRNFTRVLMSDGTSWAAGRNEQGQLANGATADSSVFVRETTFKTNIIAIGGGEAFRGGISYIIDANGILYFSGNSNDDCFGDGTPTNSAHLQFTNTAQLQNAGFQGKLTPNTSVTPKVVVSGNARVGFTSCIVLDNTGTLWCAGYNQTANLGNGTQTNVTIWTTPIVPNTEAYIKDFLPLGYAGQAQGIIAVLSDGTIICCGQNQNGMVPYEPVSLNGRFGWFEYAIGFGANNKFS